MEIRINILILIKYLLIVYAIINFVIWYFLYVLSIRYKFKRKIFFAWFNFWIGFYYDRRKRTLYYIPFPMIVFSYSKKIDKVEDIKLNKKGIIKDISNEDLNAYSSLMEARYALSRSLMDILKDWKEANIELLDEMKVDNNEE